jgi:serine/threonine protein kinase
MLNEKIGKYRITKLIGEGGMAHVYEAEHEILGRRVAVKVLKQQYSTSDPVRERFKVEARIMASLEHPNITRVFEFEEEPQRLSIIMEL